MAVLTEVPEAWTLPDFHMVVTDHLMAPGKRWAGVASRAPVEPLASPHPATVAGAVGSTTFVSSILPWRGSGGRDPWPGPDHAGRVVATLDALAPMLREQSQLVWGGDWNHSLSGPERVGSRAGRTAIHRLTRELGLSVPTANLAHRDAGLLSIDHVAVRSENAPACHVVAAVDGPRLSDHDLYVVEVATARRPLRPD